MLDGKCFIKGQKTLYIKELDQTLTQQESLNFSLKKCKEIAGFMDEEELQKFKEFSDLSFLAVSFVFQGLLGERYGY